MGSEEDYTICDTDATGHSIRFTTKLHPNATVFDLQNKLYETRPYAWDFLLFSDGNKQLSLADTAPHYVEMNRAPAPQLLAMVGSEYQSLSMGVYERQREMHDGRPFWKLKQAVKGAGIDEVQERFMYWHEDSKGWLVFQILGVTRCTMFLRDGIRCPGLGEVKWTSWTGDQWIEEKDVRIFVDPSVSPQTPETLLVTHPGLSAGVYERLGTRNARPMFRKNDNTRSLYWSAVLQSWCIAENCDLLAEEEAVLYRLIDDVPWPTQSTQAWEASAESAGDGDLVKLMVPLKKAAAPVTDAQQTVAKEMPELPGTLTTKSISASVFVADLQRAARSGSAVYIPASQVDKLLVELGQSGLSVHIDQHLEDMMDRIAFQQELKEQIRRLHAKVKLDQQNCLEGKIRPPHLALLGNPGTGKTTVAKMLGELFHSMELIKKNDVHLVTGSELLAGDETSKRNVKAAVSAARHGILLVDEAQELLADEASSDSAQEALEELIRSMDNSFSDVLIMIAGHPAEMESMIDTNAGLGHKVERLQFADYSVNELAKMLFQKIEENGLQGAIDVTNDAVAGFFNKVLPEKRCKYNGILPELFFQKSKEELAKELRAKYPQKQAPESKKRTLKLEHLDCADKLAL